jgi:hypothetical protein
MILFTVRCDRTSLASGYHACFLARIPDILSEAFRRFASVTPRKYQDNSPALNYTTTVLFHIISNVFFQNHPAIRRRKI